MLTYALVDRGTISINGLDHQTGDKASFHGRYYTDKLPGFSFLGTGPYAVAKLVRRLPDHPLHRPAFRYWEADYWVSLGVSGVLTAWTGLLLAGLARDLGCGPRCSFLVALAYGLGTPAYVYATMSYGHQATAFALLASFLLLWRPGPARVGPRMLAAGFLAGYAALIELSVGPVSAILGIYLIVLVATGQRKLSSLGDFAVGALVPSVILLGYNYLAYGSPWDMGYFHHATAIFARVHNTRNPLGLRYPDWSKAVPLLWGSYRGLLFYAPVVAASIPGWLVLLVRRQWAVAIVSTLVVAAVFLVNLSYPEWSGGWSTGPRLLVPMLPFALIPVAALLASGGRLARWVVTLLTLAGGVVNLLFEGVGARLPQDLLDPVRVVVLPAWRGDTLPPWWIGERFTRNLCEQAFPTYVASLSPAWQWVQFLPLIAFEALFIALFMLVDRRYASQGISH